MSDSVPEYARPNWEDGRLLNSPRDLPGGLPLWSGKGAPPPVGETVKLKGSKRLTAVIERYSIEEGWLMAWGTRCDGKRGNLAGAEILYTE